MKDISETRYNTNAVKERLLEFRDREEEIQDQLQRLDVMETRITSIGSPTISDMPKSPSPFQDRSAYLIELKIDLEQEIKKKQDEQKRERREIEKIIKCLRNADERSVIRARYIDCSFYHNDRLSDWNDVNNSMFGGREDFLEKEESYLRRVHRIHGLALLNMTKYIEEHPV